jgi:FkbM family methyltransferase
VAVNGSKMLGGAIAGAGLLAARLLPKDSSGKARAYAAEKLAATYTHDTPQGPIVFFCDARMAYKAVSQALRTEPETRGWVDTHIQPGECLWDIGANVGVWSLYAARTRGCRVVAFEPSAQTFGVLYKNILANRLDGLISAYCVALSDKTGVDDLYIWGAEPGTSMHALGAPQNVRGAFKEEFKQAALSYRVDDFVKLSGVPAPDHIKLDIDGIEELALRGGAETLRQVKSLIIERENVRADAEAWFTRIKTMMAEAGLELQPATPREHGYNEVFLRVGG